MENFIYQQLAGRYSFLNLKIFSNTLVDWLLTFIMFLAALAVLAAIRKIIISKLKTVLKKVSYDLSEIIIKAVKSIHRLFYIIAALFFAIQFLEISPRLSQFFFAVFSIVLLYYLVLFIQRIIEFGANKLALKKEKDGEDPNLVKFAASILKIVLWIPAVLMVVSNLGYNITSLIAGLGIGGIAVALALQNILGDLFSSLTIYFDKPFKPGDFININDKMGTVKSVGIKSTRINLLQGEELIVSNRDLTNSQIRNFGALKRRRANFSIGVTYDTPREKLPEIIEILKNTVQSQKLADLDRCHFTTFGDSSLVFETVFYYNSPNYADYLDAQQKINLEILEKFEKIGVKIAFPTRTLYIEQKDK
jgi:small-conductance mechanosensitive channel